ncbi:hypothetical protein ACIPUB_10585 [Paeniglutamicibacter sp. ORCA_105]
MVNSTEAPRGFMLAVVLIVSTILALLYVLDARTGQAASHPV